MNVDDSSVPSLRFEERKLKPYAEPVSASELKEGVAYFGIHFIDPGLQIPIVEPLIFVGKDLRRGDVGKLYFRDADAYLHWKVETSNEDSFADAHIYTEEGINHIFEYERGLDVLLRCSLRRRESTGLNTAE